MKVIKIYDIHRNDCTMDCQCEHCGKVDVDKSAYNDSYYIHEVVPARYCPSCNKNKDGIINPKTIENDTDKLQAN